MRGFVGFGEIAYPTANMMPCMETMNPRLSGVETSAWYIGMHVTRMPGAMLAVRSLI